MPNTPVVDTLKPEDFPLSIYFFDAPKDGKYRKDEVIQVNSVSELRDAMCKYVAPHFRKGLEVRITDADDICLFHCEGGRILFPKEAVNGAAIDDDSYKQPESNSRLDSGTDSTTTGRVASSNRR